MVEEGFSDYDSRVLTPEVFDLVLNNELKRALRSQNFLTLLVVEPTPRTAEGERKKLARELARVISRVVRETDILAPDENGRLLLVLLDADFENSMHVVHRLMARIEHYEFTSPASISIGGACCPTHGADIEALRSAAASQRVPIHREARGDSNAK
jgi:hypothetical protein